MQRVGEYPGLKLPGKRYMPVGSGTGEKSSKSFQAKKPLQARLNML